MVPTRCSIEADLGIINLDEHLSLCYYIWNANVCVCACVKVNVHALVFASQMQVVWVQIYDGWFCVTGTVENTIKHTANHTYTHTAPHKHPLQSVTAVSLFLKTLPSSGAIANTSPPQ